MRNEAIHNNIGSKRLLAKLSVLVLLSLAYGLLHSCILDTVEPEGMSASDRDGATVADGQTLVRLVISAKDMDALYVTRTTDYDVNAEEGEFMHTLCVFIVDETGTIEKKVQPDFTDANSEYYVDALTGDLTTYVEELDDLSAGEKTIYAFSNWDNMDCKAWTDLIDKKSKRYNH